MRVGHKMLGRTHGKHHKEHMLQIHWIRQTYYSSTVSVQRNRIRVRVGYKIPDIHIENHKEHMMHMHMLVAKAE